MSNAAYIYQTPSLRSLLSEPYLSDLRWVARKMMEGWNPRNTMAAMAAGSFQWVTDDGKVGGPPSNDHTPGVSEWHDYGGYMELTTNGSVPSWMGVAACQISPFPNELFGWRALNPDMLGTAYATTSDYQLVRISLAAQANIVGWQNWTVEITEGSNFYFPAPIDRMKSNFVDKHEDGEDPDPGGDTVARFNPRTATSTVGCYIMSKDDIREFLNDLWTTDVIDSIRNAFIGDGSNALLGVRWFYGIKDKLHSAGSAKISLGNVVFKDIPSYPVANSEFVEFDCGSVAVPQYYGDFRDWNATTYKAYIPFVGMIDLLAGDVVGKTLYLRYLINISDGSAVAVLSTTPTAPNGAGTIFTATCSWGYDIPVRVDSMLDAVARITKVSLGSIPILGGGLGEASAYSTGDLAPNSNIMGDFIPKIVIYRKDDLSGGQFADAEGAPGTNPISVGDASGYLKTSVVYNAGSLAMRRSGEIISMLQEGIYI